VSRSGGATPNQLGIAPCLLGIGEAPVETLPGIAIDTTVNSGIEQGDPVRFHSPAGTPYRMDVADLLEFEPSRAMG